MQLPDERVTTQRTNERTNVGRKEGRKEGELGRKRERRNSHRERERALNSIRPETNNSGLCWIDTRSSFSIAVYARSGQQAISAIMAWIQNGWLIPYPESDLGPPKGLIPLMAILQESKQKVRPVMDYRELNEHVNAYTANADVCAQTVAGMATAGAKSRHSGTTPVISADPRWQVIVTVPNGEN